MTRTLLHLCTKYFDSEFHDNRLRRVAVIVSQADTHRQKLNTQVKTETSPTAWYGSETYLKPRFRDLLEKPTLRPALLRYTYYS